jgi:hypothetical protein
MTTTQRLERLNEMRTTLQQRLLLLLVKIPQVMEHEKGFVEAEVEEYRDHLDGVDVLIQRLRREKAGEDTLRGKGSGFFDWQRRGFDA